MRPAEDGAGRPRPLALAAAQTVPVRGDVGANVAEHLELARLAAALEADVLVFPELSLTGYELDLASASAFSPVDARLDPLRGAAEAHGMALVVGAPVRLGGSLHVGAFLLAPGAAPALYTKHRLGAFSDTARVDGDVPPAESTVFRAGTRSPLLPIGGLEAAVAVCADIGSDDHARAASERGASVYLASMFVIPSEYERDVERLAGHARRHAMAAVLANFGGPSGGLRAAGRSAMLSERGDVVAQLGASGAGVALGRRLAAGWRGEARALA